MNHLKNVLAGEPLQERRGILVDELIAREQEVALAIFWLKLNPSKFSPKLKPVEKADEKKKAGEDGKKDEKDKASFVDFSEWNMMPTELEFDHQGTFHQIDSNFWRYEGGESKSSPNGI